MNNAPPDAPGGAAGGGETAGDAIARLTRRFAAAGIESARLDAALLVAAAAGTTADALRSRPERRLGPAEAGRLARYARRRADLREPVSRILGRREFWSLGFTVTPATLDPRPDSETLVEAALTVMPGGAARVLDLGTGTGCLLLAVLHERPAAEGIGTDIDADAVATARQNAAALGLEGRGHFICTRWGDGVRGRFDLILANPPYIPAGEIDGLAPEVARHDPRGALEGGADGLDAYREVAPLLPDLLAPGGRAVFEVGDGQSDAVTSLFRAAGLETAATRADLSGVPRCLILHGN